ncbi:hypothetical protein Lal_00022889 [Lupinus albus]|nr:hypothetical protein Lal_00022889 [Lupinus albus]
MGQMATSLNTLHSQNYDKLRSHIVIKPRNVSVITLRSGRQIELEKEHDVDAPKRNKSVLEENENTTRETHANKPFSRITKQKDLIVQVHTLTKSSFATLSTFVLQAIVGHAARFSLEREGLAQARGTELLPGFYLEILLEQERARLGERWLTWVSGILGYTEGFSPERDLARLGEGEGCGH